MTFVQRFTKTLSAYPHHHVLVLDGGYVALRKGLTMYLNEIARAGRAAEMETLHVMVMTPRGELRKLVVALKAPKPNKKKPALRAVHCDDA